MYDRETFDEIIDDSWKIFKNYSLGAGNVNALRQ